MHGGRGRRSPVRHLAEGLGSLDTLYTAAYNTGMTKTQYTKGDKVTFIDRDGKTRQGVVSREYKGNVIVSTPTVSARGRLPVVMAMVVPPSRIVG